MSQAGFQGVNLFTADFAAPHKSQHRRKAPQMERVISVDKKNIQENQYITSFAYFLISHWNL
jgi:hypothetical protein